MEARNKYAALMEARLANFLSQEELEGQPLMIQQLRSKLSALQANEQHRAKKVEDFKGELTARVAEKVAIMGDLESLKEKFNEKLRIGKKQFERSDVLLAGQSLRDMTRLWTRPGRIFGRGKRRTKWRSGCRKFGQRSKL